MYLYRSPFSKRAWSVGARPWRASRECDRVSSVDKSAGEASYRRQARTLAVYEDVGALAVCAQQYGVLVDLRL